MTTVRWQPDRTTLPPAWPLPPLPTAMLRGLTGRCPACGETHLFNGFLKIVATCRNCDAPLGQARADDAPPYFVILITGHIVIPLLLFMQKLRDPPSWELAVIFLPLTLLLALALLRPVKGGVLGAMVSLGMLQCQPLSE